jgi:hypothetical protein
MKKKLPSVATATIQYFTDEGNVIVKTSGGSVALYFDDIMKL